MKPKHSSICLAGLGNIGSQMIDALARWDVRRGLLVDREVYDAGNLRSQKIRPREVGRSKVAVQAARLRQLNPGMTVETWDADVRVLPLGALRGALVLGCLDSVGARLRLAEMAWRAGAVYLDAGVNPAAGLARVSCFVPDKGACFACGLSDADFDGLGARHPCHPDHVAEPTGGGYALGQMAAAWLATEAERRLRGEDGALTGGHELLVMPASGKVVVTRLTLNPQCRFDHRSWVIDPFAGLSPDATLHDALELARVSFGCKNHPPLALKVPGLRLAKALHCRGCGRMTERLQIVGRAKPGKCRHCGGHALELVGLKMVDQIDRNLPKALLETPMRLIGFCPGDVVMAVSRGVSRFLEIPSDGAPRAAAFQQWKPML